MLAASNTIKVEDIEINQPQTTTTKIETYSNTVSEYYNNNNNNSNETVGSFPEHNSAAAPQNPHHSQHHPPLKEEEKEEETQIHIAVSVTGSCINPTSKVETAGSNKHTASLSMAESEAFPSAPGTVVPGQCATVTPTQSCAPAVPPSDEIDSCSMNTAGT